MIVGKVGKPETHIFFWPEMFGEINNEKTRKLGQCFLHSDISFNF